MGRYEHDDSRPYAKFGNTKVGQFLAMILNWCHRTFIAPLDEFFSRTTGKNQERSRARRWMICWAWGLLVLILAAAITAGVISSNQRDFALTKSQVIEQGTLLVEDFSACVMEIDLHGQPITADTACNQQNVFPAGTRISLVQDPSDPTRYLAVAPGQDWEPDPLGTIIGGSIIGLMAVGFTVIIGHRILIRNEKARQQPARESACQERVAAQEKPAGSAALEEIDAAWERKKFQFANSWMNLADMNIRIRAILLALVLIAVSVLAIIFGAADTVDVSRDRQLVRHEPIVNTVLLEIGGRGNNAKVGLGTKVYELQYGLRWEIFRPTGQDIQVIQDPEDAERLIPVEIDDHRGLIGFVQDNLPTILIWIALNSFLVWMFIPREIAALAERMDKLLGRKKGTSRH